VCWKVSQETAILAAVVPGAIGLLALLALMSIGLVAARARAGWRDRGSLLGSERPGAVGVAVALVVAITLAALLVLPDGGHAHDHRKVTFSSPAAASPPVSAPAIDVAGVTPFGSVNDPATLDLPPAAPTPTTTTTAPPPVAAVTSTTVAKPVPKKVLARKPAPARVATTTTTMAPPPPMAARDTHVWKLHHAIDQWLTGQADASSVAVGVSFASGDGQVWTSDAMRTGTPAPIHAGDTYGTLSITKSFTEALVLRQVAAGTINLDAPVPALPGIDPMPDGVVITPRMLLQHTSGLVDYLRATNYDATRMISPADTVNLALHTPLMFPPGSAASYSRTNFQWLGLLLEHVTGQTYGELVAGLAREFGLTHTSLDPAARPGWVGYASGGVQSTVGELTRWGAALFTPGRVLQPEQLSLLTTIGDVGASLGMWPLCPCHTGPDGKKVNDAIGQVVAHGGILYFPSDRMVMVLHVDPPTSEISDQVAAIATMVRTGLSS
jgi:CubicO group peptidase (beta-lactamase class C family)